jgi:hypothetical protein
VAFIHTVFDAETFPYMLEYQVAQEADEPVIVHLHLGLRNSHSLDSLTYSGGVTTDQIHGFYLPKRCMALDRIE